MNPCIKHVYLCAKRRRDLEKGGGERDEGITPEPWVGGELGKIDAELPA